MTGIIDPVEVTGNCLSCISGSLPSFPPMPDVPDLPGFPPIPGIPFEFDMDLTMPGLPTMIAGSFGALNAGMEFVADFLPLDPLNLPSLPTIDLFVEGFTLAAPGLPSIPGGTVDLPGISVPVPEIAGFDYPPLPAVPDMPSLPTFDPTCVINFAGMMIGLPFLLIKGIVDDMLNLEFKLPTLPEIEGKIVDLGLSIGIPEVTIGTFSGCMAEQIEGSLSELG